MKIPEILFLIQKYNESLKKTSVTIPQCELLSLLQVNLCLILKCDSIEVPHNLDVMKHPQESYF